MENSMTEPILQSSNIAENMQLKKVTQQRKMQVILSQNGNTDERRKEANNTSVKSLKDTKLPLDIDEYDKLLISQSEFIFTKN